MFDTVYALLALIGRCIRVFSSLPFSWSLPLGGLRGGSFGSQAKKLNKSKQTRTGHE